ncbi:MAG: hypothetical protein V1790_01715 [Planctomycetota bacterium]
MIPKTTTGLCPHCRGSATNDIRPVFNSAWMGEPAWLLRNQLILPDLRFRGVEDGSNSMDSAREIRLRADLNLDCHVDLRDFAIFQNSMIGP